jgi:hypothetical protein
MEEIMNQHGDTKHSKMEAVTTEATSCPFASATLFSKGLERVIEASKTSLDLAVEQNAEVLASCKKALNASFMPGLFLFDWAGQAFEGYVTLQKGLLDFTLEQSNTLAEATHEYRHDASRAQAGITNAFRHSVDHADAAQKTVLDLAAKQTKEVSDTVKHQHAVTHTH